MQRERLVLVVGLGLSLLGTAALGVALLPTRAPPARTSETYQSLQEHRAVRADVRGADPAQAVTARETAAPATSAPYAAPVQRFQIKRVGIDAPVVPLNLTPAGAMDVPNSPEVVAWYDFTGKPGLGGNAVFSGHVDWRNYGPAVFWRLKDLVPGDEIDVRLTDGTTIKYSVVATSSFTVREMNMAEILAPTPVESITLITCTGQFSSGEYDRRLVVRAARTSVSRPQS